MSHRPIPSRSQLPRLARYAFHSSWLLAKRIGGRIDSLLFREIVANSARASVDTVMKPRQLLIGNRPVRSDGKREDKMREERERGRERIGGEVNQSVNKSVRCARVKLGAK